MPMFTKKLTVICSTEFHDTVMKRLLPAWRELKARKSLERANRANDPSLVISLDELNGHTYGYSALFREAMEDFARKLRSECRERGIRTNWRHQEDGTEMPSI